MFQFLIGRLATVDRLKAQNYEVGFQFLIGRLATEKWQELQAWREQVSIPHR